MGAFKQQHIAELDGVRGVACLSVLLAHCLLGVMYVSPGTPLFPLFELLSGPPLQFLLAGVDLFFVLSGFLIGGILLDNRNSPNYFKVFWTRRIARIFPVAYLLLAIYALALFVRSRFDLPQLDLWLLRQPAPPLWSYATFTQSIPMALTGYGPRWVGITWSLAIEEQFYLLFPFLVYFLSRRSIVITAIAAIVAAPILRNIITARYGGAASYVLLPCRMDSLMFGALAAAIVRNELAFQIAKRMRLAFDIVIVLIGCAIAYQTFPITSGALRYSGIALMFALLILRIFLYEPGPYHWFLRTKVLTGIGLISYALYMYHQAVNGLMHAFIFNQEPRISTVADLLVAFAVMAIAVGLATLSYIYFERPIRRLAQRVSYSSKLSQGASLRPRLLHSAYRQPGGVRLPSISPSELKPAAAEYPCR
jgi:peptidoglycan/LPS O-acetylase OafA/YrhL